MTFGQPARPANMLEIVAINQGRRPYSWTAPACPLVEPADAARRIDAGLLALDVRDPSIFAEGHLPGSWSVQLASPQFEQRVGWVLPPEQRILLVVGAAGEERAALHKLAFVGLDQRVEGALEIGAWRRAERPEALLPQINARELQAALGKGEIDVLDVRDDSEWAGGHVPGATHLPLARLGQDPTGHTLDPERPLAVVCAGGWRSATACSLLAAQGFRRLSNVTGGTQGWRRAGLPVE